jgi:hypothetical protein
MTHDFYSEVHVLTSTLIPIVSAVHLVVRELIDTTRSPWLGRRKNLPQVRVTQWNEQFTRVSFGSSPAKSQEPLTITIGIATNKLQLMPITSSCSKPSRWRQPPRITRKPQSQWFSAPRCNHSSKCTMYHSHLTMTMNQWRRLVGGVCLTSQGCITDENMQESELEPAQVYLWSPLGSKSHWARAELTRLTDWTLSRVWSARSSPLMSSTCPHFKSRPLDFNGVTPQNFLFWVVHEKH